MKETKGRQVEEILSELGKKIDVLISETKEAKDDVTADIEKKIQELKKRKEKLEKDWEEYKEQDKWQETKSHFMNALHEVRAAIDTLFTRNK